MAERRSALGEVGASQVQRILDRSQEKIEAETSSGRGKPGHGGELGRDKTGRSKATYDVSADVQNRVRSIAEGEGVVIGDIVEAALLAFCNAYDAGKIDLQDYRIPTRSLKADWKLELPENFSFFS